MNRITGDVKIFETSGMLSRRDFRCTARIGHVVRPGCNLGSPVSTQQTRCRYPARPLIYCRYRGRPGTG